MTLRKERGFTQIEFAEAIESTQRAISYYENEGGYPPAPILARMASVLGVSADDLLGLKRPKEPSPLEDPNNRKLWKKFQQLLKLPEKDQRAVFRLIGSLVSVHGKGL